VPSHHTLIINNPEIAAVYLQEFERTWALAKDPDPAEKGCPTVKPAALKPLLSSRAPAVEANPTPSAPAPAKHTQTEPCAIKGNIDAKGNKYYYLPGDPGYGSVKIDEAQGEKMFCTEQEAQQAGWQRKTN
jgi:hypothetical protein